MNQVKSAYIYVYSATVAPMAGWLLWRCVKKNEMQIMKKDNYFHHHLLIYVYSTKEALKLRSQLCFNYMGILMAPKYNKAVSHAWFRMEWVLSSCFSVSQICKTNIDWRWKRWKKRNLGRGWNKFRFVKLAARETRSTSISLLYSGSLLQRFCADKLNY